MKNVVFVSLALASVPLSASVIDFNTLPGVNNSAFTSYSESGFTVTANAGSWQVATIFGNPAPDVYCQFCNNGALLITGGTFTFTSVDLGLATSSGYGYVLSGSYQGSAVLNQSGSTPGLASGTWVTVNNNTPAQLLDHLLIQINTAPANDGNVDNIVLNGAAVASVPEPATCALLLGGLSLIALRRKM